LNPTPVLIKLTNVSGIVESVLSIFGGYAN